MQDGRSYPALRVVTAPALPVEKLVLGQTAEDAAALLPRLFNLCRTAQAIAARAAFGLPLAPGWEEELRQDIIKEHVAKLCLKWPALVSVPPLTLPRDWRSSSAGTRHAVFGPDGRMPQSFDGLCAFLETPHGIAPVLNAIARLFAPGEACRAGLPFATPDSVFDPVAQDNSVAARQSQNALLGDIEARIGRGPLWAAVAVACDLEACLMGQHLTVQSEPGRAVVPAARGFYGVTARIDAGRVTAFGRITPTDHLLAAGGGLERSLASLPSARAQALAPLLLAILDPCYPVRLAPADPREAAHA